MGVFKINKNINDFSEQDFQNEVSQEDKSNEEKQTINFNNNLSVSKKQFRNNISKALELFSNKLEKTINSLGKLIVDSYSVAIKRFNSYFTNEFLTDLSDFLIKFPNAVKKLEIELLDTLYNAKWFEGCIIYISISNIQEYFDILEHTRNGSKNRTKQIDKFIFSYINKQKVEEIRKSWRNHNLDTYILKICNQAVYAYERKEYALTVIALSSLWQGIIADKSNHTYEYRKDDKTKDDFKHLSSETESYSRAYDFFKNYIMYPCTSKDDVIEDVPGRHSSLHSWYKRYPSKKSALNAILLTDYLIKITPLQNE